MANLTQPGKTDTKSAFNPMIFPPRSGVKQEDSEVLEARWLSRMSCVLSVLLLAVKWAVKGVQSSLVRFQSARSCVFSGKGCDH